MVAAWKETLEQLTGTELGGEDEIGVGGLGTAGSGYGGGLAGLGGKRYHGSNGIETGPAVWLPPVRTDGHGHARLTVPLPDGETTWQIVLVGVPDRGTPAVTSLDVPVALPLSVAVRTGAAWIAGDRVGVAIELRNRTDRALSVSLRVAASGAAVLVDRAAASRGGVAAGGRGRGVDSARERGRCGDRRARRGGSGAWGRVGCGSPRVGDPPRG